MYLLIILAAREMFLTESIRLDNEHSLTSSHGIKGIVESKFGEHKPCGVGDKFVENEKAETGNVLVYKYSRPPIIRTN